MYANSGDPDQTPRFAASGWGRHCLPMSHKRDARLIWVRKVLCLTVYVFVIKKMGMFSTSTQIPDSVNIQKRNTLGVSKTNFKVGERHFRNPQHFD